MPAGGAAVVGVAAEVVGNVCDRMGNVAYLLDLLADVDEEVGYAENLIQLRTDGVAAATFSQGMLADVALGTTNRAGV